MSDLFTDRRPPLNKLIEDLADMKNSRDTIRQYYRQGKYKPASDAHVTGYVAMFRGTV